MPHPERLHLHRAYVGCRLNLVLDDAPRWVKITSFTKDGNVIACRYHPYPNNHRVLKRYTLRPSDLNPKSRKSS